MQILPNLYKKYLENSTICTDSRKAKPNSIFFALKGANFNGNQFAKQALANGCNFAVIDEKAYAKNNESYILVPDALKTLQQLAKYHRNQFQCKIIGITGTNGKTTTKELIKTVLQKKYKTYATEGNYNNHIGVPLSILKIEKEHEIGIIEMGANHIGEIEFLCQIAQPDYGVITNIGKAHLEGFGSYENIIKAKSELYNYIANKHGMIFVNADDQLLLNLSKQLGIKKFTYGIKENAHINSNNIASTPYLNFDYSSPDKNPVSIQTNMIGDYNLPNFLCAIAAGVFFNIPSNKVKEGCEEYIPHNNRSQFFKTNKNELILDCYNANPSSMKVALESFKKANSDNKTVILGDMFELGNNNLAAHTEIARIATNSNFNQTFFIGENFKKALDRMDIDIGAFSSTNEFINWLKINKIENNLILIKGSRLMKLEETSKYL